MGEENLGKRRGVVRVTLSYEGPPSTEDSVPRPNTEKPRPNTEKPVHRPRPRIVTIPSVPVTPCLPPEPVPEPVPIPVPSFPPAPRGKSRRGLGLLSGLFVAGGMVAVILSRPPELEPIETTRAEPTVHAPIETPPVPVAPTEKMPAPAVPIEEPATTPRSLPKASPKRAMQPAKEPRKIRKRWDGNSPYMPVRMNGR